MSIRIRLENERKSIVYHLESAKKRLEEEPDNEEIKKQIEKIESYIAGIDKAIEEL